MHLGFCMLLRKHLIGSKIRKIYNKGLERIVIFELECYNELNDLVNKKLVLELMGKHSNIILVNENNRIIDSLRHLDTYSKSYRNILPAHEYVFPISEKLDFYNIENFEEFYSIINNGYENIVEAITLNFNGISNFFIETSLKILGIDSLINLESCLKLYNYLRNILNNIGTSNLICKNFENNYTIVLENNNTPLQINFFIDDFYYQKETDNIFMEYRTNLSKLVLLTLKKVTKKLSNINSKLKECDKMNIYKLYGELIIANLYKLNNINDTSVTLENYYDNNNLITIPLDKRFSVSDNAKNYFKKYNKLKNALEIVTVQKVETQKELNYIESIIYELENSKTVCDIDEIYNEISESPLFNNIKKYKSKKISKVSNKKYVESINPIIFEIDGYSVYVGKNNKQNDYLSTKFAKKDDIWFHTKEIHGSHVILKTNGTSPTLETLEKCASLTAYFSKAKLSSNVPVDYTFAKYVKKPSGSKPRNSNIYK
ncbi:MAG: fibronectin/fibrinogen-binding protein [Clostridia bacterium]|nr:fibronectin/fibrinogen-binding protein [Clostridia bacterium]